MQIISHKLIKKLSENYWRSVMNAWAFKESKCTAVGGGKGEMHITRWLRLQYHCHCRVSDLRLSGGCVRSWRWKNVWTVLERLRKSGRERCCCIQSTPSFLCCTTRMEWFTTMVSSRYTSPLDLSVTCDITCFLGSSVWFYHWATKTCLDV